MFVVPTSLTSPQARPSHNPPPVRTRAEMLLANDKYLANIVEQIFGGPLRHLASAPSQLMLLADSQKRETRYVTPPVVIGSAIRTVGLGLLTLLKADTTTAQWVGYEILTSAGFGTAGSIRCGRRYGSSCGTSIARGYHIPFGWKQCVPESAVEGFGGGPTFGV
ncbi:hypothetical protein B0T25DRAFT_11542 [Lasiosphaeria hispida]|uniref:Uncharacterized protein n=1 Tax=Lasiosphaeria hispida TaxID=260671 RepID=A0AAJ0MJC5_9PEZI|nr:hypothetical protein B0T25DRAFT_11542 [Lasiosphaeria hispida]